MAVEDLQSSSIDRRILSCLPEHSLFAQSCCIPDDLRHSFPKAPIIHSSSRWLQMWRLLQHIIRLPPLVVADSLIIIETFECDLEDTSPPYEYYSKEIDFSVIRGQLGLYPIELAIL